LVVSDWRQIQARIRKAKTSSEPAAQLTKLFERTRDAMAAFELAGVEERAGNAAEAIRWYTVAAQRFRRADWKTKAHDGLIRLGAPIPETASPESPKAQPEEMAEPAVSVSSSLFTFEERVETAPSAEVEQVAASDEFFRRVLDEERPAPLAKPPATSKSAAASTEGAAGPRRRHRGRRGGRGRRKGKAPIAAGTSAAPAATRVPDVAAAAPIAASRPDATAESVYTARPWEAPAPPPSLSERAAAAETRTIETHAPVRGRPGDPALSSRQANLESQLRRLLAATPHSVGEADLAPAGPGVFLVSDSDQITYYYVESCQTLRIGIANVLRERRGRTTEHEPLRARFAENLGIPEARVSKYLKDYCLVRWLQLDEGASHLAHFAIAVLRPALND